MTPFEQYWEVVPVKVKRKLSADIWKRKRLDDKLQIILADIENRKRADDRWMRGYIPDPPTYLRQERWEDEIVRPHKSSRSTMSAAHVIFTPEPRASINHDAIHAGVLAAKAAMRRS